MKPETANLAPLREVVSYFWTLNTGEVAHANRADCIVGRGTGAKRRRRILAVIWPDFANGRDPDGLRMECGHTGPIPTDHEGKRYFARRRRCTECRRQGNP